MNEAVREAEATPPAAANLWSVAVITAMAWIFPGMGHLLLKRYRNGLVFLIGIVLLFFLGLHYGAKIYRYEDHQPLTFFAMIAQLGMGLPYFLAKFVVAFGSSHPGSSLFLFAERFQFGEGNVAAVTFEYGNTFVIVAGLLNFLVVLDAYDIAIGRKKK